MKRAPKPKRLGIGSNHALRGPYLSGNYVLVGVLSETLQSLDRKTLKVTYDFGKKPGLLSGGVEAGAVVVMWDPTNAKGNVGVKDVTTGALLWTRGCTEHFANVRGSNILVRDGDSVLVLSGSGQLIYPQDGLGSPTSEGSRGDGVLLVNSSWDETVAISEGGAVVWRRPLADEFVQRAAPGYHKNDPAFVTVVDGGECFAFSACGTCRISMEDGSIRWTNEVGPMMRPFYATPVVSNDLVLGVDDSDCRVFGIERGSGNVRLNVRHSELEGAYRVNTGVVYGRRYAFCFQSGRLAIVDIDTGSLVNFLQWRTPLWRLMELDGRLLAATGDGELLVFDESIWGL